MPVTEFASGSRKQVLIFLLLNLTGLFALYLFFQYLKTGGWRRRLLASSVVVGLVLGAVLDVRPVQLFLLYYLVPLFTWGTFVNQVRTLAEHYTEGLFGRGPGVPEVLWTRDVRPSLFDRLFVTTRAVNYHLSHHLFPAVPFYNLARLERQLANSEFYRKNAHVTRGYHRFLMELLTKQRSTVST